MVSSTDSVGFWLCLGLLLRPQLTVRTEVDGFTFSPGSVFFANLSWMQQDPAEFPQPQLFSPERHLAAGKFKHSDRLVPYGIGKAAVNKNLGTG